MEITNKLFIFSEISQRKYLQILCGYTANLMRNSQAYTKQCHLVGTLNKYHEILFVIDFHGTKKKRGWFRQMLKKYYSTCLNQDCVHKVIYNLIFNVEL